MKYLTYKFILSVDYRYTSVMTLGPGRSQRRKQGGLLPPPHTWISEIFWFQGGFHFQTPRVDAPSPGEENKWRWPGKIPVGEIFIQSGQHQVLKWKIAMCDAQRYFWIIHQCFCFIKYSFAGYLQKWLAYVLFIKTTEKLKKIISFRSR